MEHWYTTINTHECKLKRALSSASLSAANLNMKSADNATIFCTIARGRIVVVPSRRGRSLPKNGVDAKVYSRERERDRDRIAAVYYILSIMKGERQGNGYHFRVVSSTYRREDARFPARTSFLDV